MPILLPLIALGGGVAWGSWSNNKTPMIIGAIVGGLVVYKLKK